IVLFFSSRRRHTRFSRDWSSDVCSSDLSSLLVLVDDEFNHVDPVFERRLNNESKGEKCHFFTRFRYVLCQGEDQASKGFVVAFEIGRASCRERVEIVVFAGSVNNMTTVQ